MTVLELDRVTAAAVLLADDVSPAPACAAPALRELRARLAHASGVDVAHLTAAARAVINPESK